MKTLIPWRGVAGLFVLAGVSFSTKMALAYDQLRVSYDPGEIVIVDPSGRRTGLEDKGGIVLREIPRSDYACHVGNPSGKQICEIEVLDPAEGDYKLIIYRPPLDFVSKNGEDYDGSVSLFSQNPPDSVTLDFDGFMDASENHIYKFHVPSEPSNSQRPLELSLDGESMTKDRKIPGLLIHKKGSGGGLLVVSPKSLCVGFGSKPFGQSGSLADIEGSSWHYTQTYCTVQNRSVPCANSTWVFIPKPDGGTYNIELSPSSLQDSELTLEALAWEGSGKTVKSAPVSFRPNTGSVTQFALSYTPNSGYGLQIDRRK